MEYYQQKETVETYDTTRFASPQGSFFNDLEKDAIRRLVPWQAEKKILEVGCGTGRFSREIASTRKVFCVDSSQEMMRECLFKADSAGKRSNIFGIIGNAFHLPIKPGSVDCVFSVHVIWHYPNYEPMIQEFSTAIPKNGSIILDFINARSYLDRVTPTKKAREGVFVYERRFSITEIRQRLQLLGLKLDEYVGVNCVPLLYKIFRFSRTFAWRIEKAISQSFFAPILAKRVFVRISKF